jgi:serine protease Do
MNIMIRRVFALLLLMGYWFSVSSYAGTPQDNSLAPMLQKILPAVVNIRADIKITDISTLYRLEKEKQEQAQAQGNNAAANEPIPDTFLSIASGVIVDADRGYILTNSHVVNDAQSVTVTLSDGRHFTAKVVGLDKPSDVALLQIKAKGLTAIPMANSNLLKVGDYVAAIGNPFGLNQTVTSGIVSALGRTALGIESFENFIQTDAPINPGNSGGALVDTDGELVGINTAILAPDRGSIGIGFAIPSNIAKSIMGQLILYGNVQRGTLGIGAQDLTPDLANAFHLDNNLKGAAVTLVRPGSPAEKAGLQVGDVITGVDSIDIKNANDVVTTVGFLRVNSKISIEVLRDNKHITLNATLSDPKQLKEASETVNPFLYGVGLKNFSLYSPVHGDIRGVLVVSVEPGSHAWQADLRPGDVITSANQQKVSTIADLQAIAGKSSDSMLVNVLREAGAVFLVINKEKS